MMSRVSDSPDEGLGAGPAAPCVRAPEPDAESLLTWLVCEGPHALSDEALMALLLGGPRGEETARQVSLQFPDRALLRRATFEELTRIPGVDRFKAGMLQAAFELGRRIAGRSWRRGERLRCSAEVYRALAPTLRDLRQEVFLVVLLDGRNRKIAEVRVSVGSLSASIVHPREVFLPAVRISAAAILLAHNHPSGDPRPSEEDREVTWRLAEAGDLLGIRVLDHVIVGEDAYHSFADEGTLHPRPRAGARGAVSGYDTDLPKRNRGA
jgi:DNA repair protein RadC